MSATEKPAEAWKGEFGDAYVDRNAATPEHVGNVERGFREIFAHVAPPPATILEVGANIGNNLRALKKFTDAELMAVEPNAKARARLVEDDVLSPSRIFDAFATDLPLDDGAADLVFTSGVLIHVPPVDLEAAYREMYRVSGRYLLSIEYFSPQPVEIPYRGHDGMLFKRDFGGMWLDLFPDLDPIANGFFWKRTTGLDDLNWWLFAKP